MQKFGNYVNTKSKNGLVPTYFKSRRIKYYKKIKQTNCKLQNFYLKLNNGNTNFNGRNIDDDRFNVNENFSFYCFIKKEISSHNENNYILVF